MCSLLHTPSDDMNMNSPSSTSSGRIFTTESQLEMSHCPRDHHCNHCIWTLLDIINNGCHERKQVEEIELCDSCVGAGRRSCLCFLDILSGACRYIPASCRYQRGLLRSSVVLVRMQSSALEPWTTQLSSHPLSLCRECVCSCQSVFTPFVPLLASRSSHGSHAGFKHQLLRLSLCCVVCFWGKWSFCVFSLRFRRWISRGSPLWRWSWAVECLRWRCCSSSSSTCRSGGETMNLTKVPADRHRSTLHISCS